MDGTAGVLSVPKTHDSLDKSVLTKIFVMNEVILVLLVIFVSLGTYLLSRGTKRPLPNYVRIIVATTLLIFIWIFARHSNVVPRVLLTILMLMSILREYFLLKRRHLPNDTGK